MSPTPLDILNQVFGYDDFRGDQEAIIAQVTGGGDALVLMPTGGGKSLCYQIPALVRPGTTVVISPLIALMQDQVTALRQLGVRAAFLNSSLTPDQAWALEQELLQGRLDLVYVAPERLLTERFLNLLEQVPLALFAIDEAHCVSQWGHDFRPEYVQLGILQERWPGVPRIALTATADAPTRNEIAARLHLERARIFVASFDRPNIRYRVVEKANPRQQLLRFLRREHPHDAGIVYCLSRRKVEETAAFLQSQGFNALPYHAGLSPELRQANQDRFLREEGVLIVATIAFGMGIDKPDVRFVAHLDLPKSLEAYYQETGRAGRDGLPADAWMTYGLADVVLLRRILEESDAEERFKRIERHKLNAMLGYCETTECRRQVLLHYFGEPLPAPCGNCDTCLEPVETWDGTEAARKALSCAYRTGQRFGSAYLVDVLLGRDNERIRRFGHDRVSTFGIGKELGAEQWKSVYRQLVAAGLMRVDMEGHGALKLAPESRPLLRGERSLRLRRDPDRQAPKAEGRRAVPETFADPADHALWEALRRHRMQLARDQGVPPYVIFSDATLKEMVLYRPRERGELTRISGVGAVKLERYGDQFLEVLAQHARTHGRPEPPPLRPERASRHNAEKGLSDTVLETLALLRSGMGPETIAEQRALKTDTVYNHLARGIAQGELEADDAFAAIGLDPDSVQQIQGALAQAPEHAPLALKPAFEALQGRYSYGALRCVHCAMKRAKQLNAPHRAPDCHDTAL
jgi:ATP-dependent DNA helicase RecQ